MAKSIKLSGIMTGEDIVKLNAKQLCELGEELCRLIQSEVGSGGFRGGVWPGNISLDEEGNLSLGSAKSGDWSEEELKFIAPELYWHGKAAPSGDVYSVGMLLYYGVSGGKLPFEGDGKAQLRRMGGESFPAPEQASRRLSEIIEKATRFSAAERYQSLEELRRSLESCEKNIYVEKTGAAGAIFKKDEAELSDIERMMLSIIHGPETEDEDALEEVIEEAEELVEETEDVIEETEEVIEETEEVIEETEEVIEETEEVIEEAEEIVEEAVGEVTEESPEEKAEEKEINPDDSDAAEKAANEAAEKAAILEDKTEPIPILTVEKNPELEPVVVPIIPAVQYSKSLERERKIAEEVKKRRRRPMMLILVCCAALIAIAIVVNAIRRDNRPRRDAAPSPSVVVTATVPQYQPVATEPPVQEYKQSRYEIFHEDVSWTDALDLCLEKGGHLAVITDLAEYEKVVKAAEEAGVYMLWIGCYRNGDELRWVTNEQADYMPWADGEPSYVDSYDGAAEAYVMLCKDNSWYLNDSRNNPAGEFPQWYSGKIGYICEFED